MDQLTQRVQGSREDLSSLRPVTRGAFAWSPGDVKTRLRSRVRQDVDCVVHPRPGGRGYEGTFSPLGVINREAIMNDSFENNVPQASCLPVVSRVR